MNDLLSPRAPLALLLVAALTASLAVPARAQDTLEAQGGTVAFKIGTWNLEFLGAEGNFRNNLPPRDDADYAAIGKKVRELGVAVLAVQEINDDATLRKVAAGAGPTWQVLLGTTGTWDDGKTAQSIGFLWDDAAVALLSAEELLQLPRQHEGLPIFHRVPVTACFRHQRTGCDFRLVTVHMKAGQKQEDERKRRGEAQALAAWLDALRDDANEDQDVVLLGDFNSTYGTEPEAAFEQSKQRRYLEARVVAPTIMHFPEPIDQVVASNLFHELRVDSLTIDGDCDGQPRDAWRKTYSDHFPVTATIVGRTDDDPRAGFRRGPEEQHLPRPRLRPRPPQTGTPAGPTTLPLTAWPWQVGTRVVITADNGRTEGVLLQPLPEGPGGWVVVQTGSGTVAIPVHRVERVQLL